MMSTQDQTMRNSQDQKLKIEEILEKLRQRDSQLFKQIIDAIRNQDDYASRILVSEVAEIRKVIVLIENKGADILTSNIKSPSLLLCPSCYSPEISISQSSTSSKYHCLDCDKIWIAVMGGNRVKEIENTWSLA
jgi:hypothetical protein